MQSVTRDMRKRFKCKKTTNAVQYSNIKRMFEVAAIPCVSNASSTCIASIVVRYQKSFYQNVILL